MQRVFGVLFIAQDSPGKRLDPLSIGEKQLLHEFAFIRVIDAAGGKHGSQQTRPLLFKCSLSEL